MLALHTLPNGQILAALGVDWLLGSASCISSTWTTDDFLPGVGSSIVSPIDQVSQLVKAVSFGLMGLPESCQSCLPASLLGCNG